MWKGRGTTSAKGGYGGENEGEVMGIKVWENFELNQLKSAPSQLLPVFLGFDRLQTCCHQFGPADIL